MALSQKWKDTVNKGITDKRWDEYDSVIKVEVAYYSAKFARRSLTVEVPVPTISWLLIKAIKNMFPNLKRGKK